MRNILKASHASLKKDWYGGEKPGCEPGRTNRAYDRRTRARRVMR